MAVKSVHIESEAYLVCLTHALSTEREEIMGLLIGDIDNENVSRISAVIMLRRSDKQSDRVEISPEQLSAASTDAERLAVELDRPMRVIGWYHSHPHITVWPSHVDVRTQAMYQMMDPGFVGLIFSVFNQDKNTKQNRVQVTCFQASDNSSDYTRIEIPMHIVPSKKIGSACIQSLVTLPNILTMEEEEAYQRAAENKDLDLITKVHNASVYTKSLCHVIDVMNGPVLQTLENRLERNKNRIQALEKEKEDLLKILEET
ncbi:lys-63-specific deubiquitinase BRCC36-like [Ruditapes philippinarum]|uniref:lys-63-specific deubiquitinase BRCC36-like n=1 Tax=Ruditapes philippinarum TaxID=129788 RepID=UPI00295BA3D0|nr:lys-63-specific deubiquitinase BRCC36-like [Ruditapes philippinarum]